MEELKARIDLLTDDVTELREKVELVGAKVHEIDKAHAVIATNFTTMSQNVATLTTSVATLAVTINKQTGAFSVLKFIWAILGGLITWAMSEWKGWSK